MQNTFSQSGNDSKWFLKKTFFKIGMWHSRPPRDPPPFMANAILNFHFDYLTTSLSVYRAKYKKSYYNYNTFHKSGWNSKILSMIKRRINSSVTEFILWAFSYKFETSPSHKIWWGTRRTYYCMKSCKVGSLTGKWAESAFSWYLNVLELHKQDRHSLP